jgi:hypothetical protein
MLPRYPCRRKWLALTLAAYCAAAAGSPAPPVTVAELLRSLIATGEEVLYSTDLVPNTLMAPAATQTPDLLSRVSAALATHHLQLKRVDAHRYIVTRETPKPLGSATAADSGLIRSVSPLSALEEVVVFASHYTFDSGLHGEPNAMDHRAIEQVAGAQNDALRAVRSAPGVASTYSARPYIRGGTADDVLVRFDGVTLTNPFHFREFQSLLSPFVPAEVERIDLYAGGFPARFGTRTAGVIDVAPRTVSALYDVRADASRLGIDLSGAGRSGHWPLEWLASVRGSPNETNILQPIDANPSDPVFFDALARVHWTVNPHAGATVGWLLLDDSARVRAGARDELASARSRDQYAWLGWDWSPTQALQSHSSLSYTKSENGHFGGLRLTGLAEGTLIEDHDFSSLAARSEWVYAPSTALLWNVGIELASESAELQYQQQEVFTNLLVPSVLAQTQINVNSTSNPHSLTSALFGSARRHWRLFEAELGGRLDSQDYRTFGVRTQFTPRVNLRYDPATAWHLYASWGEFSQAQRVDEFREEESQSSADAATRASHTVVGVAHERGGSMRWQIELFSNHWSSVSPYEINTLGPVTLLPELQPDRIRIAPLSSESDGIELSARRSVGNHLNLWGTYTLSRAVDRLASGDLPRSWDQRHATNLGLAWNSPQFTASVFLSWHSGWPRTSISTIGALPNSPPYLLLGAPNTMRWGDYLSADVRVSRSLLTRLGELSLWLEVTNATNRGNDCCAELAPVLAPATQPTWSSDSWAGRRVSVGLSWRLQKNR